MCVEFVYQPLIATLINVYKWHLTDVTKLMTAKNKQYDHTGRLSTKSFLITIETKTMLYGPIFL